MSDTNKTNDWQERECGALWKRKSATQTYLSGHVEVDELGTKVKKKIVIFSNKHKKKDNHPDYRVYLSTAMPTTKEEVVSSTSSTSSSADAVEEELL